MPLECLKRVWIINRPSTDVRKSMGAFNLTWETLLASPLLTLRL
jgi:hypothetical protein